jgi:hypothetical protein
MAIKSRTLLTLFFLAAAVICYAIGSVEGFAVVLIAAVIFELLFWIKLFGKGR